MDAAEISWRIRSILRDQLDAVRIFLGLLPALSDDGNQSAINFAPGFRCSPSSLENWLEPLSEIKRVWRARLIEKADLVLDNRLSYFDLESVHHSDPINWHRDFSAEIDAPVILSVHSDYRNFSKFGDCKLVWEPNRHHQLVVLGRAFVATGERQYALKVAELLRSWIDANPFGYGMNWRSPLELGVRLINWVWAIDLIREANVFDTKLWNDILQNVHWAAWDCQRKFSQGSSANNHLIGEAAGVFFATCYFSDLPNAKQWQESSQNILEHEIVAQSYADGCTREHAFGYQFFVIQFFTQCLCAAKKTGIKFSDAYQTRLHAMYRFVREISADTGAPPNMGDQDSGYVVDLGELPPDALRLMAVGAFLFDDPSLNSCEASESAFWHFGDVEQDVGKRSATEASVQFADSGYFLLRSPRMAVFFDCAPLGYGPIAAHGHADCLSLCLSFEGLPIFVDSGTYDYFSYPDWRNHLRETRAHNTAEIDGVSQSQNLGPFIWGKRASAKLTEWDDSVGVVSVSGEHDGYLRLDDPVMHQRRLVLDKTSGALTVTDRFDSKSEHRVSIRFYLDTAVEALQKSRNEIKIISSRTELLFRSPNAVATLHHASSESKMGWISHGYHQLSPSMYIEIQQDFDGNAEFVFEILIPE